MKTRLVSLAICIAALAIGASAQTVTGSGTTNTVPVFTGSSTVGNSPISVSGSNVGIGTTNPAGTLQVQTGNYDLLTSTWTVDIGLGDAPAGWARAFRVVDASGSNGQNGGAFGTVGYGSTPGYAYMSIPTNDPTGYDSSKILVLNNSGNVGVGTSAPAYKLDVAGAIRSSAGGVVFPDGTTQTTAFIPANCGADFAESVGVTGSPKKYGPGDLLVIDPNKPGKFLQSSEPYSTMVAGIYSTRPGFVGRLHPASDPASAGEIPMAMVGRVPTNVSAENGPIKVGDLLVASSLPGYAMKGTDRNKMLGAVIGKALEPLDSGSGTIMVLVTLQ